LRCDPIVITAESETNDGKLGRDLISGPPGGDVRTILPEALSEAFRGFRGARAAVVSLTALD
jgi:hypothetical protein